MIGNTLNTIKALLADEYPELNASLNPPATEADISQFETATGLVLPEELKQLYRLHNGESGHAGLFFGLPFISIDEALAEWKVWESLAASTAAMDSNIISVPANHIKEQYINTRYIPISKDYGGNFIGIDLDPAPDGVSGQVINFGRDEDTRFVIASSLAGFLDFILHHVKNGNYRFEINGDEEEEEPRSFLIKEPANSHFLDALKELQLPFGTQAETPNEEDYDTWFAALDATWQDIIGPGQSFAALAKMTSINLIKKNLTQVQPLARFTGLRELLLSANPIVDISPLSALTSLNKLYIAKTNVTDISPLAQLKELKQLSIYDTAITSLEVLQQLPKLKSLSIEKTAVADLAQVITLRQLTELDIAGKQFPSFTELLNLKKLVKLKLSDTNIPDIAFLTGLPNLSNLELCGTPVTDLSPLLQMNKLTNLSLDLQDFKAIVDKLRPGISIGVCGELTEEDWVLLRSYGQRK